MNVLTMAATPAVASPETVALQRHLKLQDAAEKFEGMMLQELLKPMQEGKDGSFGGYGGGFGTSDEDRDDSLDTISSFGTEAIANAIAKAGGFGIAKQVLREVGALDADKSLDASKFADNREIVGYNKGPKLQNGSSKYLNGSVKDHNGSFDGKADKKS